MQTYSMESTGDMRWLNHMRLNRTQHGLKYMFAVCSSNFNQQMNRSTLVPTKLFLGWTFDRSAICAPSLEGIPGLSGSLVILSSGVSPDCPWLESIHNLICFTDSMSFGPFLIDSVFANSFQLLTFGIILLLSWFLGAFAKMANNIFERYRPSGGIRFLQFWHCVWYSNVGMIAISCRSQPWSETGISIRSNVLANGCHQCALCLLPCISKSVPVSCSYPQQCTREWLLQLCSRRLLWHRKWVLSICSYLQQYIINGLI